jgi:tripartite-type tricarboxylate transporter receptor subunit TctC
MLREQSLSTRPVRIIVGFAAGGGSDILARMWGQWLTERLGRPFVIENRPGAGTNIATEAVVRSPPDGYTLLQVNAPAAINATLYDKLNFVVLRDIAPVASITRTGYVLAVHPSFPGQDGSRVHQLRRSKCRQDQHGVAGRWDATSSIR